MAKPYYVKFETPENLVSPILEIYLDVFYENTDYWVRRICRKKFG